MWRCIYVPSFLRRLNARTGLGRAYVHDIMGYGIFLIVLGGVLAAVEILRRIFGDGTDGRDGRPARPSPPRELLGCSTDGRAFPSLPGGAGHS